MFLIAQMFTLLRIFEKLLWNSKGYPGAMPAYMAKKHKIIIIIIKSHAACVQLWVSTHHQPLGAIYKNLVLQHPHSCKALACFQRQFRGSRTKFPSPKLFFSLTWITWHVQEKFIQNVMMIQEDKEQVKFKCWAGFASEDKMRDELKMKENLVNN